MERLDFGFSVLLDNDKNFLVAVGTNLGQVQYFTDNNSKYPNAVFTTRQALPTSIPFNQYKPVNFSFDEVGSIKTDFGAITRLADDKCMGVFLRKIMNKDTVAGFEVFTKKGKVVRMPIDTLVDRASKGAIIQNAIFRDGHFSAYPNKSFEVIQMSVIEAALAKGKKPVAARNAKKQEPKAAPAPSKVVPKKRSEFTQEQLRELNMAKEHGVDPSFIKDSKYTPEQMHILWTAKENGVPSELFALPSISEKAMTVYSGSYKAFEICDNVIMWKYIMKHYKEDLSESEKYLTIYSNNYPYLAKNCNLYDILNPADREKFESKLPLAKTFGSVEAFFNTYLGGYEKLPEEMAKITESEYDTVNIKPNTEEEEQQIIYQYQMLLERKIREGKFF